MRRFLLALAFLGLALPCFAQGQFGQNLTGSLSAASPNCVAANSCVWMRLPQYQGTFSAAVTVTGVWAGTLVIEGAGSGGWSTLATWTSNQSASYNVTGDTDIRVRVSAYTSGTAVVTIALTNTSAGGPPSQAVTGGTLWTFASAGDFSNNTNEYNLSTLNSCSPSSIESTWTGKTADALAGCVSVPSSGVTNGFSNGISGFAIVNNNCASCGAYGAGAQGVGVNGSGIAAVSNARAWGGNFGAVDTASDTGNSIIAVEADATVNSSSTSGAAVWIAGGKAWTAQPTVNSIGIGNMPGVQVNNPGGGNFYTSGFACNTGATENGFPTNDIGACLVSMPYRSGNSQPSQGIIFGATNTSGTVVTQALWSVLDSTGNPSLQVASSQQGRSSSVAVLGNHSFVNNVSALNTLSYGTVTVSASTSGSYTFKNAYISAPVCTITPTSTPASVGVYWVTTSTTAVTANVTTSGTITFNFVCGPTAN